MYLTFLQSKLLRQNVSVLIKVHLSTFLPIQSKDIKNIGENGDLEDITNMLSKH